MSKVIESISEQNASFTLTASGSTRWLAPELIEGSTTSPTKQADVYSFSMACLELITGKQPWHHKRRDAAVIHTVVVLKMSPPRPGDEEINGSLSDELWEFMTRCWATKSELRPHMAEAVALLQQLHDRWCTWLIILQKQCEAYATAGERKKKSNWNTATRERYVLEPATTIKL